MRARLTDEDLEQFLEELGSQWRSHILERFRDRVLSSRRGGDGGNIRASDFESCLREVGEDTDFWQMPTKTMLREFLVWRTTRLSDRDERQNLLGRVLVSTFENMLEGRDGVDGRLGFPRSFVSVFLRSVFTLVGQDLLEDVQRDFHKVHRVIVKNGRDLEDPAVWRSLVASELVTRAVEEILVALLVPFEHYTRRKSWYISFVNRHLAPFEKTPEAGSFEHWEFREQQFSELFIRLTAPLREQLRSVAGVKQFTSNFGSRALETIRAVLVSIELDNKSLMETQEIEAVDLGV